MPVQFQREDLAGYRVGADTVSNAYNQGQQSARELVERRYIQKNDNMNRMMEARKGMDQAEQAEAMFLKGINPNTGQPLGPISPELWDSMKAGIEAKKQHWTNLYNMSSEQLPRTYTYQMETDANGKTVPKLDSQGNPIIISTFSKGIYDNENVMRDGYHIGTNSQYIANPPQSGGTTQGQPLNWGGGWDSKPAHQNPPQQQASSTPYTGAVGGNAQSNTALYGTSYKGSY